MPSTTLEELGWIHDCPLHRVSYEGAGHSLTIEVSCPADLGNAAWDGKDLEIVCEGIALLKHVAIATAGTDSIDAIRAGVSGELRAVMGDARDAGARFPRLELTIACHSGSSIEVVCGGVQLRVKDLSSARH